MEDIGKLATNELFGGNAKRVFGGIMDLNRKFSELIILTNNIFEYGYIWSRPREIYRIYEYT